MRTLKNALPTVCSIALLTWASVGATGCGQTVVTAEGEVFNRSTHKLASGSILEFSGSYGPSCLNRSGMWSVSAATLSALTYPELSVIRNDANCQLSLQMMRIGQTEAQAMMHIADDPISLDASFKQAATPFRINASGAVTLYANVRMTPDLSFGSNFTIQAMYSEDPGQAAANVGAVFELVSATTGMSTVPASDYQADASSLSIKVDANQVVTQVSGGVSLLDMGQPGEAYVLNSIDFGNTPSYGDVDLHFSLGVVTTIPGANPVIAASELNLLGANLSQPVLRSVLIAHSNQGVRSYQVIALRILGI